MYDDRGRMIDAVGSAPATSTSIDLHWDYAPGGQRIEITDGIAGSTTWLFYQGDDALSEFTETSPGVWVESARYLNGTSIDGQLARETIGGETVVYGRDGLGGVDVVMSDAGQLRNIYVTTAWGEDCASTRSVPDRFDFTGRERDQSGLMHYRARTCDPRTGRPDTAGQRRPCCGWRCETRRVGGESQLCDSAS